MSDRARPDHMAGPEWRGWEELATPSPIEWDPYEHSLVAKIAGRIVATLEPRPYYCDRGHWKVLCELPGFDGADGFPRYFMSKNAAVAETEAFLRWRLWKERAA